MPLLPTISSVGDFFSTLQLVVLSSAAAFGAGVFFSQRVKDWIGGVPSDLRSVLKGVEANVQAKVKAAQSEVVGKIVAGLSGDAAPAEVVEQKPLAPAPAPAPAPAALDPNVTGVALTPALAPAPAPAPAPADGPPKTPVVA